MKPWFNKALKVLARDLRYEEVYAKATGVAMAVAIIATIFSEVYPITCVVFGVLAGAFAVTCYFLRHYGPIIPEFKTVDLPELPIEPVESQIQSCPSCGELDGRHYSWCPIRD